MARQPAAPDTETRRRRHDRRTERQRQRAQAVTSEPCPFIGWDGRCQRNAHNHYHIAHVNSLKDEVVRFGSLRDREIRKNRINAVRQEATD